MESAIAVKLIFSIILNLTVEIQLMKMYLSTKNNLRKYLGNLILFVCKRSKRMMKMIFPMKKKILKINLKKCHYCQPTEICLEGSKIHRNGKFRQKWEKIGEKVSRVKKRVKTQTRKANRKTAAVASGMRKNWICSGECVPSSSGTRCSETGSCCRGSAETGICPKTMSSSTLK